MRPFVLTPRLRKIADLVPPDSVIWDVGTDHGKLPAWLLFNDRIKQAFATDISDAPLKSANRTAASYRVGDRMRIFCCDGLADEALLQAEVIIIAGMGGQTIVDILRKTEPGSTSGKLLLLQPMSSDENLREFLYSNNYTILNEYLVKERNWSYLIIEAIGDGIPEDYYFLDTRIGKHLIHDDNFNIYITKELKRLRAEISGCTGKEREQIDAAIFKLTRLKEEFK